MANILKVKQSVMDSLKAIGLNLYERKLWIALLSKGTATAGELADLSNVPRSRCYDVLESLADKGFVIIQPAKPMRYVAVKPKEAIERAKARLKQKTEEILERLDRLKNSEVMKDLESIYSESIKVVKPEDLSGALRGRDALMEQVGTLLSNAKKSVVAITTEQGFQDFYERYDKMLKRASNKGVKIKIAVPVSKKIQPTVKELAKIAEIRDISNVQSVGKNPTRFFAIDGKHFVMSLTNDEKTKPHEDIGFWAQSDHVAGEFFDSVFKLLWTQGKKI
ncbi:MAG: TrmB family transcriptional regulator [Candidatus Aenigmarchaeota archaeon]|nr:TrmB family transcriptional regulator [Candidatus Aenigmarchaeota archaeon]